MVFDAMGASRICFALGVRSANRCNWMLLVLIVHDSSAFEHLAQYVGEELC